jgi:hypothetical protein
MIFLFVCFFLFVLGLTQGFMIGRQVLYYFSRNPQPFFALVIFHISFPDPSTDYPVAGITGTSHHAQLPHCVSYV